MLPVIKNTELIYTIFSLQRNFIKIKLLPIENKRE